MLRATEARKRNVIPSVNDMTLLDTITFMVSSYFSAAYTVLKGNSNLILIFSLKGKSENQQHTVAEEMQNRYEVFLCLGDKQHLHIYKKLSV